MTERYSKRYAPCSSAKDVSDLFGGGGGEKVWGIKMLHSLVHKKRGESEDHSGKRERVRWKRTLQKVLSFLPLFLQPLAFYSGRIQSSLTAFWLLGTQRSALFVGKQGQVARSPSIPQISANAAESQPRPNRGGSKLLYQQFGFQNLKSDIRANHTSS